MTPTLEQVEVKPEPAFRGVLRNKRRPDEDPVAGYFLDLQAGWVRHFINISSGDHSLQVVLTMAPPEREEMWRNRIETLNQQLREIQSESPGRLVEVSPFYHGDIRAWTRKFIQTTWHDNPRVVQGVRTIWEEMQRASTGQLRYRTREQFDIDIADYLEAYQAVQIADMFEEASQAAGHQISWATDPQKAYTREWLLDNSYDVAPTRAIIEQDWHYCQ